MRIKKRYIIIGVIVVLGLVGAIGSCGDEAVEESYDWPDSELAKMIPEPEGKITFVSSSNDEYLGADVDCSDDDYKDYLAACKERGFIEKQDVSQVSDSYYYTASNKDGYELSLDYVTDYMSISLKSPAFGKDENEDSESDEGSQAEETKAAKSSDSGKVSADFKEMMDEYEDFMDEYIAFMEKYEDSSDTASMMKDYTKFMSKYSEYMEKIDAVDEDELSDADLAYYLKVTSRVSEKLANSAL